MWKSSHKHNLFRIKRKNYGSLLRHDSYFSGNFLPRPLQCVFIINKHLPGIGKECAVNNFQKSCFTGTIRADNRHNLRLIDSKRNIFHHWFCGVTEIYLFGTDYGHG